MNKIAFTVLHEVNILKGDNYRKTMSEAGFLAEMRKNIKSDDYNVNFNARDLSFTITYNGDNYQVFIPSNIRASIRTPKQAPLAKALIALAKKEKKYNDETIARNNYVNRVNRIERSGYSELKTPDDFKFYLTHLQNESKKAKTEEKKKLIETKINGLLKILTNPYNLDSYFSRFICEIASNGEGLKKEKNEQLQAILREINDDYYNITMSRKDEMLILGSSTKPMEIIRRIEKTEALVQEWLNEDKDNKFHQEEEIVETDSFNQELDEISQGLHEYMGGSTK